MTNELIWQHLDSVGWEHVRVTADHPGWTVYDSILVREHEGQVLRGGYTLVTDKNWRTLELRLMVETSPGVMEGIHLLTEGDGRWTDANQNPMPELDGCLDVEIQWTPLTRSLPVNRMDFVTGKRHEVRVVGVSLPELVARPTVITLERVNEAAIRVGSSTGGASRQLVLDGDGIVVHDPGHFMRSWPKQPGD